MFKKAWLIMIMSMMIFIVAMYMLIKSYFISLEIPFTSLFLFQMNMSIMFDYLSLMFLSTVLFISSMIMFFSISYIPNFQHNMFLYLLLMFILSMSILILSDNMIFILLGWDGLGLSSYILVVFYQNHSSAASGSITIITNRIGDIMILISISILLMNLNWNFIMNENFPFMILMLIMIAAMSKSAQFPFSAWLPAAMSAPTPISALVHSSTLVTAGIYLLIRTMNFNHPNSLTYLMIISSLTVIYSSLSAMWENDMKKIIALSTLSQMAMMMFSISLGAINIAFLHLIIHAMFKSMMFLCSGNLIFNSSYQDMRNLKSLFNTSPITSSMLGISNMSLMGIPFMSGFFSKDSIIEKMLYSKFITFLSMLMILSISMTSMYSMRMMIMSSKFMFNSKPDKMNLMSNLMEFPIFIMSFFSSSLGLMMMWINNPEQSFMLPFHMKMMIIMSLIMGIILSMSFSFKNKYYLNLGESSISLWFLHFLSSYMTSNFNLLSKSFINNDKNWQEIYGPTKMFYISKYLSKLPDKTILLYLYLMLIILIIPIILIMY